MQLRFTGKKQETYDVWSFFFDPIDPIEWIAGQSIRLELPRPNFGVSERRFTIASAPQEKRLMFSTRLSGSRFKNLLDNLEPGAVINAYGVEGDFIWQDVPKQKIFVAGGIGITPFRAMLAEGLKSGVSLVYGYSDENPAFKAELDGLKVPVNYVLGRRLAVGDIASVEGYKTALIYLSGPEAMVEALRADLEASGVEAQHIKTDLFTGFGTDNPS